MKVHTCQAGPLPDTEVDWSDVPDKCPDLPDLCTDDDSADDDDSVEDSIEDGDCILVATIPLEEEFIWASSTTLQCLAEAFHRNTEPKSFHNSIPTYLHDFEDVFSKSSFDSLPMHKPWDHVIKLVPNANPVNCKVYPLAPNEQKELKEGWWVVYYCALNVMTVKNHYPLPLISDLINQLHGAKYFTKLDV